VARPSSVGCCCRPLPSGARDRPSLQDLLIDRLPFSHYDRVETNTSG
jgi:hypothetical protein